MSASLTSIGAVSELVAQRTAEFRVHAPAPISLHNARRRNSFQAACRGHLGRRQVSNRTQLGRPVGRVELFKRYKRLKATDNFRQTTTPERKSIWATSRIG